MDHRPQFLYPPFRTAREFQVEPLATARISNWASFSMTSLADGRLRLEGIESPFRIRPLLRALYGFRRVLVAVFATFPSLACQNAGILHSSHHLELAVQFSTHEPRIMEQSIRALKRWSEVADMAWHREDSNSCSISITDGKFTDEDELAEANAEAGSIIFASADELTVNELFLAAFHEIGHLLGLKHNPSPHSVMYWIDIRGDEVLDESDMRALVATHALRVGSSCNESGSCEVLSRPLQERKLGKEMPGSEAAMIAWGNVSIEARTIHPGTMIRADP
jgi:Matrixin